MLTDMVTEELVASGVNLVQYSQVSGSTRELDTIYRQYWSPSPVLAEVRCS